MIAAVLLADAAPPSWVPILYGLGGFLLAFFLQVGLRLYAAGKNDGTKEARDAGTKNLVSLTLAEIQAARGDMKDVRAELERHVRDVDEALARQMRDISAAFKEVEDWRDRTDHRFDRIEEQRREEARRLDHLERRQAELADEMREMRGAVMTKIGEQARELAFHRGLLERDHGETMRHELESSDTKAHDTAAHDTAGIPR